MESRRQLREALWDICERDNNIDIAIYMWYDKTDVLYHRCIIACDRL